MVRYLVHIVHQVNMVGHDGLFLLEGADHSNDSDIHALPNHIHETLVNAVFDSK